MAQYHLSKGRDSLAKQFYNKSLKAPGIDPPTRRQNYRDLADNAFVRGSYVDTGAYLDSLLSQFPQESRQKTIVLQEREGLQEVIGFEKTIRETDSILTLAAMIPEEQLAFYQKAIDSKRAKELAKIELEKKPLFNVLNRSNGKQFYFYNENLVILGKQAFASDFGNRPNADNWNSLESLNGAFVSEEGETNSTNDNILIVKENAQAYVDLLPTDQTLLDSLSVLRNQAYLEVGILYKEKFKNFDLASERLKSLLVNSPSENQELNAWYHLCKMNTLKDSKQALVYEDKITQKYPESRFARIIKDPENFQLLPNETPSIRYEALYALFLKQQYEEVLAQGDDLLVIFSGTPMVSKVAHLMANATGRLDGIEAWKKELQGLIDRYPNSEAAAQAKQTLGYIAATEQAEDPPKVYLNYKWIFPVLKENQEQIQQLTALVTQTLEAGRIPHGNLSLEVYDRDYIFLVVNDLRQQPTLEVIPQGETPTELSTAISNKFVVLSSQYKEIQLFKSWNTTQKNTDYEK